jgi:alpha-beta hydrolase superfamily lysophospholipase
MACPDGRIAEFAGARHNVLNEAMRREVAAAISGFTPFIGVTHVIFH